MIDQADVRLRKWAGKVAGDVPVSLAPPVAGPGRGVGLYLMELVEAPGAHGPGRPPLRLALRYLVTAWDEAPEDAHRLLGALVFAAMDDPELEVELQPLPAAVWWAFGLAPQPSFFLRVPLSKERPAAPAKPVLKPLVVDLPGRIMLQGVVVGPGEVPLAGARVELPGLNLVGYTDAAGRFRFAHVPLEPRAKLVRVRAKGRERSLIAEAPPDGEPLVIRFGPLELMEE